MLIYGFIGIGVNLNKTDWNKLNILLEAKWSLLIFAFNFSFIWFLLK